MPARKPVFDRLAVIGCGLIGSSIARAATTRQACRSIRLFDADAQVASRLRELLPSAEIGDDLPAAVIDADLVIICTPPAQINDVAAACLPLMQDGSILSDVGSIKTGIFRGLPLSGKVRLIPAHPVAGTEQSGPEAGFASLFEGRWCALTPIGADERAPERLGEFWRRLGARVRIMDADHHDRIMAMTSHMPHLIAYAMVATAMATEDADENDVIRYSGGGFRDFTRIAASDPIMWRDILLANAGPVLEALNSFDDRLKQLKQAIIEQDGQSLSELFASTRKVRRRLVEQGEDTGKADFGRNKG